MPETNLPSLQLWEDYVQAHVRVPGTDALIEVPSDVAKELKLNGEDLDNKSSLVFSLDYREALYRQGHITPLILMYAMAGSEYDVIRRELTNLLFDYALEVNPSLEHWKGATWVSRLKEGELTLNGLAPLMTAWIRNTPSDEALRKYQYILPMYLFLGDYKTPPKDKGLLKSALYSIVAATCHIGDPTWQDVYYDVSMARRAFPDIVREVDKIFREDRSEVKMTLHGRLTFFLHRCGETSPCLIKQAGDWLAFGAYITLLSKYARYVLNADHFRDVKKMVGIEQSRYFKEIRTLLSY